MLTLFLLIVLDVAMMMPTAMPQAVPAVNTQQMAAQQQAFINQQALLLVSPPLKTHLE